MKVVASTKLTRAEKAMREAKKYGGASNGMCRDVNSTSLRDQWAAVTWRSKKPKRRVRVGVARETTRHELGFGGKRTGTSRDETDMTNVNTNGG